MDKKSDIINHNEKMRIDNCPHCEFINTRFLTTPEQNNREYWLMTEVFVYLHGTDVCNGKKK